MTSKALPEAAVLAARDAALEDNSKWPEFELTDVDIFDAGDQSSRASLLGAGVDRPLVVTGHLRPLKKEHRHLLKQTRPRAPQLIELSGVTTYCYGMFPNGEIGLWAGGAAGWYQLKPSKAYKKIWMEMVEAVEMLYWIADAHADRMGDRENLDAGALKTWKVEQLFGKYSVEVLGMPKMEYEAAQKIYKHKDFLMESMVAKKEAIPWQKSSLYMHLSRKFPKEYAAAKVRMLGPMGKPTVTPTAESVNSDAGSLKRKRGKPAKSRASDAMSVVSDSGASDSVITVASRKDNAEAASTSKVAPKGTGKVAATSCWGRKKADVQAAGGGAESQTPEKSLETTPVPESDRESRRRATKGRPALRPRATKASKGTPRSGKAPMILSNDDDDVEEDEDDAATAPVPSKRKATEEAPVPPSKWRNSRQEVDEGIDMPSSPESTEDDGTGPNEGNHGAGGGEDGGAELPLRLREHLDPVQEDTWVCALDGCSHKVYLASQADSQRLIREHYALHAYDDDARVQLVKQHRHPSLPVNHLMERVRLQARVDGFPGSRTGVGGPIDHSRYPSMPVLRY